MDNRFWYVSAVAFRLSKPNKQSAAELALEVAEALNRNTVPTDVTIHPLSTDRIWQNFTVQTASPGWIHLKFSDVGLHEWLNALVYWLPSLTLQANQHHPVDLPQVTTIDSAHTFTVLATHARCCSLLRMGMQERLIQLEQPVPNAAVWTLTQPAAFAWLDANQQFRCTHPSEWHLLAQIVDTLDELSCVSTASSAIQWQLSHRLSQNFQNFYANCRIFGTAQTADRTLAQTRLGLVFLTQALLSWLLRDWLHITPPIEL